MKNIEQINQVSGESENIEATPAEKKGSINQVVLEKAQLSSNYNNIPLAHALQSGHLLSGVLVEEHEGELNSLTNNSEFKLRKIDIPSSPSLREKLLSKWSEAAKKNAKKGAGYSLLLLPLTACGGASTKIVDKPTEGFVIDGYIRDAFVFRDANDNGVFDAGEANTLTDASGYYSLGGNLNKQIIVDGTKSAAIDIASGNAFTGVLTAPIGSSIITPLTTLVQHLIDDGMTQAAAETAVKTGLGISTTADLSIDPIANLHTGLYSAGVNVATLITAAGGGSNGAVASEALAMALKSATTEIDLTNADVVSSILSTTNLADTETVALIVSDQATILAGASSVADVANVQALTFVVAEGADVISFSGTAAGNIVVTLNSTGGATFSRSGVNGEDSSGNVITIANIGTKEINFAGELSVVVTGASTSGDDSHVINAPDATKITLRGSMGDGNDEVRIKIADDTPGTAETRTLELISDGFTVGENDRLVFDFAGEEDVVALTVDSTISQFQTIEVAKGTADLRSVTIKDDAEFIVNSSLTLTQAQFLSIESVVSASGLGQVNVTLESGQTLSTLNSSIAARSDDFVLVGTDLLIKDSTGTTVLTTTDGVATGGTTVPAAIASASYKGIPELTTHISTSISNLETQLVNGASTPLNTLGEVETYITGLNTLISKLTTLIGDSDGELTSSETSLVSRLDILEASIAGDNTAPTLTSIVISGASGNNGSYLNAGDIVTISATFDSNVLVTGTPYAQIVVGSVYQYAAYSSGAGTNVLNFNYTIDDREAPSGIAIASGSIEHRDGSAITDIAGNAAVITNSYVNANSSYIVDITAPTAVSITSSADDTSDTTPTITMTAEAGSTVKVFANGVELGTATEGTGGSAGTFTFTSSALSDGNYSIIATSTDTAGNVTSSTAQELVIDTVIPGVPTITSASLTTDTTPEITGTAEVGSTVTVVFAGATYETTATNGTWSITVGTTDSTGTLSIDANGGNSVSVTAADAAGNTSVAATQTLTMDTTVPAVAVSTDKAAGSYTVGEEINITLTFTESVTLAGANGLNVTLNTGDVLNITAAELNGVSTVTKEYTIGASDTTSALTVSGIALGSSATLKDDAGNTANLTATANITPAIVIDTTAPTAASSGAVATSNNFAANSVLAEGETVTLTFAEAVNVSSFILGTQFSPSALSAVDEAKLGTGYSVAKVGSAATATQFTITLGAGTGLDSLISAVKSDRTLTFSKDVIIDSTGNNASDNIALTSGVITDSISTIISNVSDIVESDVVTATDVTSVSQFNSVNLVTSNNVILQGGVTDEAVNFASTTGTTTSGLAAIATQDPNAVITITDAATVAQFNTANAATSSDIILQGGVTDEAVNFASTTGTTTSGLAAIATQDPNAVITITDAATVAQFNTADAATSSDIVLQGGVTDEAVKFSATDGTSTAGLIAIAAQDENAELTVTTAANMAQVTTLTASTTTNLILSGGVSDTAISMMSVDGSTASTAYTAATNEDTNVTVTVTGTNPTINQLNAIAGLTTGAVTASISGNGNDLVNLTTLGTNDQIAITVNDAISIANVNTLNAKTGTALVLTGGVSDQAINMVNAAGDTLTAGFTAATTQDPNVVVTITGGDAANAAQISAVADATTGAVTAAIAGNYSVVNALTNTDNNDQITITVNDAISIANVNTLDAKTGVDLVLTGGVSDEAVNLVAADGGNAETAGFTAATTQDPNVAVTITGGADANAAQISAVADATTGAVTAAIAGNYSVVNALTNTDNNDQITITVNDVISVANVNTLDAKTGLDLVLTGGVSDEAVNYSDAAGNASAGLDAIAAQDDDVTLTVTTAVNMLQMADINAATNTAVVLTGGISDQAVNLVSAEVGNAETTEFEAATTQDTDVAVTITGGAAATAAQISAVADATTGVVTAAITGSAADLTALTTGVNDAITMTISDGTVTAANLITLDTKTNQTVDANAVGTITGTLTEINSVIAADDAGTIAVSGNFNVTVSDTSITAAALTTMSAKTEGTVTTQATTITGTDTEIIASVNDSGITTSNNVIYDLDNADTSLVSDLTTIDNATIGNVVAANITDSFSAINALANNASQILENATGIVTAEGTFAGETISMVDVADKHALVILGNGGADTIIGSASNDTINGGTGNDVIKAGSGEDLIVISDIETGGLDKLLSFTSNGDAAGVSAGTDKIQFSTSDLESVTGFTAYTGGGTAVTLAGGNKVEFLVDGSASAGEAAFIYNTTTGKLSFDADGDGANAAIEVVQVYSDDAQSSVLADLLTADLTFIA